LAKRRWGVSQRVTQKKSLDLVSTLWYKCS